MKNTLRLILALTIYTSVWAQNDTALTKQQELKTNTLSFSALWGMFGFLHANYGRVLNDGKTEYQFMLGTFGYDDSYDNTVNDDGNTWESSLGDGYLYGFKGATGIKAAYRQYRKGNARGVFYQAHLRSLMLSWGYKSVNNDWKDVNTLNFESGAVLGYKYIPSFIHYTRTNIFILKHMI